MRLSSIGNNHCHNQETSKKTHHLVRAKLWIQYTENVSLSRKLPIEIDYRHRPLESTLKTTVLFWIEATLIEFASSNVNKERCIGMSKESQSIASLSSSACLSILQKIITSISAGADSSRFTEPNRCHSVFIAIEPRDRASPLSFSITSSRIILRAKSIDLCT